MMNNSLSQSSNGGGCCSYDDSGTNMSAAELSLPLSQSQSASSSNSTTAQCSGQHMKVFLRIRPVLSHNNSCTVKFDSDCSISIVAPEVSKRAQYTKLEERHYTFNKVFSIDSEQHEIFDNVVEPMMNRFIKDRGNCVLMAYGMTNAGKTYTMQGNPHDEGLFPRLIRKIIDVVPQESKYELKIAMSEIYQEKVYDLLSDKKVDLKLRETKDKVIEICKLTFHPVTGVANVMGLFDIAASRRSKTSTALNELSSRSHAIYTLSLDIQGVVSTFHVVDLAGAERGNRTKSSLSQQKEANYINVSLMKLWRCLQGMKKRAHDSGSGLDIIPYRESKLTYLLMPDIAKAGLNGVAMITCINPQVEDYDETISILSNASLAFKIKEIVEVISKPPPPKVKEDLNKSRSLKSSLPLNKQIKRKLTNSKELNIENDDALRASISEESSLSSLHELPFSNSDDIDFPEYKRMKLQIVQLKQENESLLRDQIVKEAEIRAEVCHEMEMHSKMLLEKIQFMQDQLYEKSRESYSITKSARKAKKATLQKANENAAIELMNAEEEIERLKLMFEIDLKAQKDERQRLEKEIETYKLEESKLAADIFKLKNSLKNDSNSRLPLSPVKSPLTNNTNSSSKLSLSSSNKASLSPFGQILQQKGNKARGSSQQVEIFSDFNSQSSDSLAHSMVFDSVEALNSSRTDYFHNLRSGKDIIVKSISESNNASSLYSRDLNNNSLETNENVNVADATANVPADTKSYFRQLRSQFSLRA